MNREREDMKRWIGWALIVGFAVSLFVSCDSASAQDETVEDEHPHYYSPYFLQGEGDLEFETITFTDVGMQQPEAGPVETILLEAIAQSLATKIVEHEGLNFTPHVEYDQGLLDPDNHLFCDDNHLYIALWRGYAPERWGYSLWSGCEAGQEFAWEEIADPFAETEVDLVMQVEPLTQSIVESINDAHATNCFVQNC